MDPRPTIALTCALRDRAPPISHLSWRTSGYLATAEQSRRAEALRKRCVEGQGEEPRRKSAGGGLGTGDPPAESGPANAARYPKETFFIGVRFYIAAD
jgi:hypothetical protein